jgi:anti-sigma factor RsiW
MTDDSGITELDLLAYADGRLEPARAQQVEAALAADPELRAKVADFAAQNRELAAQFDAYANAPLPERLARMLAQDSDRTKRHEVRRTLVRAAAVVLIALAAGTGGWTLGRMDLRGGSGAEVLAGAAALHETGRAGRGATAATAGGSARPLTWFADRIALELQLPDLRDRGFALVRKDRVELAGTQGLRLRYTAPTGQHLDVFLKSRWRQRASPIATHRRGDVALAHWMDGPLRVVVAGDGDARGTVRRLAAALRTRLNARNGAQGGTAPNLEPHGTDTPGRETATRSPRVRPPADAPGAATATDLVRPATDGGR